MVGEKIVFTGLDEIINWVVVFLSTPPIFEVRPAFATLWRMRNVWECCVVFLCVCAVFDGVTQDANAGQPRQCHTAHSASSPKPPTTIAPASTRPPASTTWFCIMSEKRIRRRATKRWEWWRDDCGKTGGMNHTEVMVSFLLLLLFFVCCCGHESSATCGATCDHATFN